MSTLVWQEVGSLSDIPVRGSRRFTHDGFRIAVFRTASDQVYALHDRCPHKGGPLSEGIAHDNCVTCPLHNWVISLESGKAQGADSGRTNTFPVKIHEQIVSVALPDTDK